MPSLFQEERNILFTRDSELSVREICTTSLKRLLSLVSQYFTFPQLLLFIQLSV